MHPGNYLEILEFSIKFHGLESHGIRLSNVPGYPGNLLELLKFFSTGNPGILLEFCQVCWKFYGAVQFAAIDITQRRMLKRFSPRCHGKNRIDFV